MASPKGVRLYRGDMTTQHGPASVGEMVDGVARSGGLQRPGLDPDP